MRRFVLWDTACNFNDVIQKFKNLKCLITGTSTLYIYYSFSFPLFLFHSSPPTDNVISVYEEHEDSVYNVKWSTTDAWIFASLSYDGRLVINHVPTNEKYAILTA